MKSAIVIYDTMYGSTEKIARALMEGMEGKELKVDICKANEVDVSKLGEYDLLAVGGPTHAFRASKPIKELLKKLGGADLRGKKVFAFDTKFKKWWAGSAAKGIEKNLSKLGMEVVRPCHSAAVKGGKGPLEEGAEEEFKKIGREIAESIR